MDEKSFKSRPQNKILIPLTGGSFQNFRRAPPSILCGIPPPRVVLVVGGRAVDKVDRIPRTLVGPQLWARTWEWGYVAGLDTARFLKNIFQGHPTTVFSQMLSNDVLGYLEYF